VWPNQIRNPLLVYTGTDDGNVVKQLRLQQRQIETSGGELKVIENCNHLGLVEDSEKVCTIVEPFIHESFARLDVVCSGSILTSR
jgi:pimeloyl-ACP methyl ester carboxylesterase